MRVLITGGAGLIGSYLAEELHRRNDTICVIDNLSTGSLNNIKHMLDKPRFHFVKETVLNELVLDKLVSECDVIYHLAASVGVKLVVGKPVETIQTNVLGTELVLKLADRYFKKVLIASTSEMYGKSAKVPFKEDDDRVLGSTTKNRWSYACTKAIDEFLALAYYKEKQLPIIIARLFNTVGPKQTEQYGMVLPQFVKQALNDEDITVYGTGEQTRCFTDVADTVRALIGLMRNDKAIGQVFNIGSHNRISILKLAQRIKEKTNSQSQIKLISYDEAYEKGFEDMMVRVPDLSKIKSVIDYDPQIDLEGILERVINYLRKNK